MYIQTRVWRNLPGVSRNSTMAVQILISGIRIAFLLPPAL